MKQVCEFCDSIIKDTDEVCPHCGAPNSHVVRVAEGLPKTIAELKAYAQAHNWPLKKMRVFIGEDFKEPRAFGIYEENGIFIVYKNKSDGSRAVRYKGKDEAYAVNELYEKCHSEIMKRKQGGSPKPSSGKSQKPDKSAKLFLIIAAVVFLILFITSSICQHYTPKKGYYSYQDVPYYYQSGTWYSYGDGDWSEVTPDDELKSNFNDYRDYSDHGSEFDRFEDSDFYQEDSKDFDNDWDDDDDWDTGGDWDAGGTDWDSDW